MFQVLEPPLWTFRDGRSKSKQGQPTFAVGGGVDWPFTIVAGLVAAVALAIPDPLRYQIFKV